MTISYKFGSSNSELGINTQPYLPEKSEVKLVYSIPTMNLSLALTLINKTTAQSQTPP